MWITVLRVFIFNLYGAVISPAELTCSRACCLGEGHKVFCFSREESAPEWAWCLGPRKEGVWDFPSLCKWDKDHCTGMLLHGIVCMLWKMFFMCWGNFTKTKAKLKNTFPTGRFPAFIIILGSCKQTSRCLLQLPTGPLSQNLTVSALLHSPFSQNMLVCRPWHLIFLTGL